MSAFVIVQGHAAASPVWTPVDLGEIVEAYWDVTEVTLSGSSIATVVDQSAHGRTLLPTYGAPAYVTSMTKPFVRFNSGATNGLRAAFPLSAPYHILVAASLTGTGSGSNFSVVDGANTVNTSRLFVAAGVPRWLNTYAGGSGPGVQIEALLNQWLVMDVVFNTGVNATKVRVDGGAQATGATTPAPEGISIGCSPGPMEYCQMDWVGTLVTNRELTVEEYAQTATFFATLYPLGAD